jgi:hypothetical protein
MCVENYAGMLSWLIGDRVVLDPPYYMRSMSNPNSGSTRQPDTYMGNYWEDPYSYFDNGGVHINSGIQNFWFYLLSSGGNGTNDNGDAYSVNGIGITDAQQIAYRNLINYLAPYATHIDAFYGSMHAAEDLFGNPSAQLTAVQQAWYAVGIDSTTRPPTQPYGCFDYYTSSTGTLSDGSGAGTPYDANVYCEYIIVPDCATQITLNFTSFDTEAGYDYVRIYEGIDASGNLIGTYSGRLAPFSVSTSEGTGAMYIVFSTDEAVEGDGWEAYYTSNTDENASYCSGLKYLTDASGTLSDGGNGTYCSGMYCIWTIVPPNANKITIEFSKFNLGNSYSDGILVADVKSIDEIFDYSQILGEFYGNELPPALTATSGGMVVLFVSNYYDHGTGWTANYYTNGEKPKPDPDPDPDPDNNEIKIYPNPIKSINEKATIEFPNPTNNAKIGVYDFMGKAIKIIELNESTPFISYKLSVNEIPNGLYILRIDLGTMNKVGKLLIGR